MEQINTQDFDYSSLNGLETSHYGKLLHTSSHPSRVLRSVSPPIVMSTNFHYPSDNDPSNQEQDYYYSRHHNPNFTDLEEALCAMHDGYKAVSFASGMGAIAGVILGLGRSSGIVVCSDEVYHDVHTLLETMKSRYNQNYALVDIMDTGAVLEKVKDDSVFMLYMESSSNPNNKMPDLEKLVPLVRKANPKCLIVCDNTLLSPALFRPLSHDIDIVIESATKYISGKGDALAAAAIVGKPLYRKKSEYVLEGLVERIYQWRLLGGACPSPISCWLACKGLETLPLRMARVSQSATVVAAMLESLPCVSRVTFPTLKSHPCHEVATRLCPQGSGGLFRFHLPITGKDSSMLKKLIQLSDVLVCAVSFGDAHSLVQPGTMGHNRVFVTDDKGEANTWMDGTWFRIAIGLQDPLEICNALLNVLVYVNELVRAVGKVKKVNKDKGEVTIKLSNNDATASTYNGAPVWLNVGTGNVGEHQAVLKPHFLTSAIESARKSKEKKPSSLKIRLPEAAIGQVEADAPIFAFKSAASIATDKKLYL